MHSRTWLLLTVVAFLAACGEEPARPDVGKTEEPVVDVQEAPPIAPPLEVDVTVAPEVAATPEASAADVVVEPRYYDPIPVEGPAPDEAQQAGQQAEPAARQVVPLAEGADPFSSLAPPETPELEAGDPKADTLRLGPEAPPEPGQVEEPFPPDVPEAAAPEVRIPPMKVVRHYPDEEVELIDQVSVTFSHPMVPLADLEALAKLPSPLSITPEVKGEFIWLGTDTVAFRPEGRMPYGNTYTALVASGVKSALGGVLEEPYAFDFKTPRPKLIGSVPVDGAESLSPDTDVTLYFNAAVDPEAVLPLLQLNDVEGKNYPVKLVGRPPKDPDAVGRVAEDEDERRRSRAMVVKPAAPLPTGMHFVLTIGEKLTSTEGPLAAETKHFVRFATYFPLEVTGISCSWGSGPCYPGSPIRVEFNNELRKQNLDKRITVAPAAENLRLRVQGASVVAFGDFLPSETYTVHVSVGVEDVHGQKNLAGHSGKVSYREASPVMSLARTGMLVLEARQSHEIDVTAMNLDEGRLTLAYVPPSRIFQAIDAVNDYYRWEQEPTKPFQVMQEGPLKLTDQPNRIKRQSIELDAGLANRNSPYGIVFIDLKARRSRGLFNGWHNFRETALVQITDLALTAAQSQDELHVLATRLSTGEPLHRATVKLYQKSSGRELAVGHTDADGLVKLDGPNRLTSSEGPYVLTVELGSDLAFLVLNGHVDEGSYQSSYSYRQSPPQPELAGLVFSERGLYRPHEEVHLTVMARRRTRGPEGDLEPLPENLRNFTWTVHDPRWNELASGKVRLSPFGMGTFSIKTDGNAPLGSYSVSVNAPGAGELSGSFEIQEYRTPEFEVSTAFNHHDETILVGRRLDAAVTGTYYFGAPMNGASVDWTLYRQASHYAPPGNQGFHFGTITNEPRGRRSYEYAKYSRRERGGPGQFVDSGSGSLDGQGRLQVPVHLDPGHFTDGPVSFTLEAQVYDQNRQSVAGRTTLLAHRAERYVGLAVDRTVVSAGETVEVSGVVTRLDGSRHDDADITVKLMLTRWIDEEVVDESGGVDYDYRYEEEEAGNCTIKAGQEPGRCVLTVRQPGSYVLRAETRDKAGRPARSALRVYAYGADTSNWTPDPEFRVDLVLDQKEYQAGDKARLLIQSPFPKARGLLTISREGFSSVKPIELDSPAVAVDVPIDERWLPSVTVNVVLVRGRIDEPGKTKDDRGRPAFAAGSIQLPVSRQHRTIQVDVKPRASDVKPGSEATVDLTTTDSLGEPMAAQVAFMVVDEGVLSLIAYATPNPLAALYHVLSADTGFTDLRPMVLPRIKPKIEFSVDDEGGEKKEEEKMMAEEAPSAMPGGMARAAPRMKSKRAASKKDGKNGDDDVAPEFSLRQFFASTAYFNDNIRTDASGKATVTFKMPDNLTRFRVMAIAANKGHKFGSSDAQVRTRRPLVIRPALPRFLNFGDSFQAAAVINNETGFDTDVMVRCLAANASVEENVKTVTVPHGKAVEVSFPAKAGQPGPATFQFAAVALTEDRATDAAVVTIPTLIPATSEAFATYGVVDEATKQPIAPPTDAIPGFGGLDVALSSTALTGLQDSVRYLFDYPYECTEQLCSRLLPILALGDVLRDFKLGTAETPEEAAELVKDGLAKLYLRQRPDGGFGFWPGSDESWLYLSAYAAMTLQIAAERGFDVRDDVLQQAYSFLEERLDHPYLWEAKAWGSQTMAVLVLARARRDPASHVKRLAGKADDKDEFTLYATAWLWEAASLMPDLAQGEFVAKLRQRITNSAIETASAIHFSEARSESLRLMMHSDDRTDAIVLHALLVAAPGDPLIEKVVRGLVRARVQGRWSTTQANAYALLSLARYYAEYEKAVPDFKARLWYGQTTIAASEFKGRSMAIRKTHVPMKDLLAESARELVLAKQGPGRLYYRLGLKYAPSDLKYDALDRGFMVERVYLPEGEDGQLTQREDGAWVAKAGTYVRVKLRVVAPDRRFYVAVVDPLPAGLEAVNESFATSATQRLGSSSTTTYPSHRGWYWSSWNPWDFEERRDDRVQIFSDRMYGGTYEYTYVTRATTVGEFTVPPTRAEEMYEPETFGRSASTRFIVEE